MIFNVSNQPGYNNFLNSHSEWIKTEMDKDVRNTDKGDAYKSFINAADEIGKFADGIGVDAGVNYDVDVSEDNGQAKTQDDILNMVDRLKRLR